MLTTSNPISKLLQLKVIFLFIYFYKTQNGNYPPPVPNYFGGHGFFPFGLLSGKGFKSGSGPNGSNLAPGGGMNDGYFYY